MGGPEYLSWLDEQEPHTALMGATTYRLLSEIAAQTPDEAGLGGLTEMPKVVFSSTLEPPLRWANTQPSCGDAIGAGGMLRETSALPLHPLGSLSVCRSLLQAGLVDRYRVVVFPVI